MTDSATWRPRDRPTRTVIEPKAAPKPDRQPKHSAKQAPKPKEK